MLTNVAVVLLNGVHPFELGVVCEVFGLDRSDQGLPVYDFAVASAEGPALRTHAGFSVHTEHGLERLESADLIAVPAGNTYATREYPPELLDALRRGVERGARVLSVCSECSCSPPRGSSTDGGAPRTGGTRTNSPSGIRASTSSRTSCTSTRAR